MLEKILYGLKTTNDNLLVLNEKIDALMKMLSCSYNVDDSDTTEVSDN